MPLKETVAKNLFMRRMAKKWSQETLAEKSGLSVSYISMLERGQRTPPLHTVERLAAALMVDPVNLVKA